MGRRTVDDYEEEDCWDEDRLRRRRRTSRTSRSSRPSRAPLVILLIGGGVLLIGGGVFLICLLAGRPREQLKKNEERLIGKWSAVVREVPRRVAVFEFRGDGVFVLTMSDDRGRSVSDQGTWKVLGGKGDTIRIRMEGGGKSDEKNIELLPGDRFRYTTGNGTVINATRVR
jgi:uncharacterized protein (TIGR03066 family)